jgi:hypothetical protein
MRIRFAILFSATAFFGLALSTDAQCPEICTGPYEYNTALGANTLENNKTGAANTAIGFAALEANTFGCSNTATGSSALAANTLGESNTAIGAGALSSIIMAIPTQLLALLRCDQIPRAMTT